MHFVICVFIALICLVAAILFTEVFPKPFKIILTLLGSFTSGYALAILIRKIAMTSKAFTVFPLWPTIGVCSVAILILIIIVVFVIKKKKA